MGIFEQMQDCGTDAAFSDFAFFSFPTVVYGGQEGRDGGGWGAGATSSNDFDPYTGAKQRRLFYDTCV